MPQHYTPTRRYVNIHAQQGVDIIGDIHGCFDELMTLVEMAGYQVTEVNSGYGYDIRHPDDRKLILVGDLTDRGPSNVKTLRFVRSLIALNVGLCLIGNHDYKLLRYLRGNNVKVAHGLELTIQEMDELHENERSDLTDMIAGFPSQVILRKPGQQDVVVVHAAAPEHHQHEQGSDDITCSNTTFSRAIYGYPVDSDAKVMKRDDWAKDYAGPRIVIHGHEVNKTPYIKNNVFNIDTGCVFGGRLTMYSPYEGKFRSTPAQRVYHHRDNFSEY